MTLPPLGTADPQSELVRGEEEEGDGPRGAEEDGAAARGAAAAREEAEVVAVAGTRTVAGISGRGG